MKRTLLLIILLVLVVVAWYGYKEYNRKNIDLATAKPAATLQAKDLITAFEKDSAKANKDYLGKIIQVTGNIKNIEKENGVTVVLGDAGSMSSIRCSMDTAHLQQMATLTKGQNISITGNCTGYNADEMGLGADVILNRCVLPQSKN